MASKFSDVEARAIIERSRETLLRLDGDTDAMENLEEISEPKPTLEDILAQPCESHNEGVRRRLEERNRAWAAQRAKREATLSDAMTALEIRLDARAAGLLDQQREVALSLVSEALELFAEKVTVPLESQVAALREEIKTLRERQRVFGTAEPLDLPNILDARRIQ